MSQLTRRSLLHGGALVAGAVALGACTTDDASGPAGTTAGTSTAGTAPTGTAPAGSTTPTAPFDDGLLRLFADDGINFEFLFTLGAAGYGAAELGEVVAAASAAGYGADIQAAFDAFAAMSERVAGEEPPGGASPDDVSSRDRLLRSAEYLAGPLFFVLGTSAPEQEPEVFATLKDRWVRAGELFDPPIQRVTIPYEDTTLPGYWLPALGGGPERRPTVIVNNGSDGQTVETFSWGGRAAQERGWNALLLEGPGQGEMLFEREVPMRHDWEAVITPVVDFLVARPDVDPERIALTGWSMGGELVSRAAAFEPRLRALVTDPGAVNIWLAFPEEIRSIADAGDAEQVNQIWSSDVIPSLSPEVAYTLKKRLEIFSTDALRQARAGQVPTDWYGLSQTIQQFRSDDVAPRITVPTLVIDYEGEQFYPGQAKQLYDLLTVDRKELVTLGAADGAQLHCAPMAPQFRNEVVYDWLDDVTR